MVRSRVFAAALSLAVVLPAARAQASREYAEDLLDRHRYHDAVQVLEDIAARPGADADIYEMLADAYIGVKQPEQATAAIERGMRADPGAPSLQNYYVALLRRTLPPSQVQKKLFEIFNQYPHSAVFQKAAARLLFEANPQDDRAGALLAMAAHELPDDPEVHFFFGQWLCLNEREPACVAELSRAAEQTEEKNYEALAQIWALIATAQMNMGQKDEALGAWEKALHANEASRRPSPELGVRYAAFLRNLGREGDADRRLRETLRRFPDFGPAHFEAAQVAFSRHEYDTAEREALKALSFRGYPEQARGEIHRFLASVYFNAGRLADADHERAWVAEHSNAQAEP